MREQLVCTKCWRWYDERTTCPTCKLPLIHADSGRPVTEIQAPPPPARQPNPMYHMIPGAGAPPGTPGATPSVSGYPSGSPVAPLARRDIQSRLERAQAAPPVGIPLEGSPVLPPSGPPGPLPAIFGRPLEASSDPPAPVLPWTPVPSQAGDAAAAPPPPPPPPPPPAGFTPAAPPAPPVPPSFSSPSAPPAGPAGVPTFAGPSPIPWAPDPVPAPGAVPPALDPVPETWALDPVTPPEPPQQVVDPLPWLAAPDPAPASVAPSQSATPATWNTRSSPSASPGSSSWDSDGELVHHPAPVPEGLLSVDPVPPAPDPATLGPARPAPMTPAPQAAAPAGFVLSPAPAGPLAAVAVAPAPVGGPIPLAPFSWERTWGTLSTAEAQPMRGADGITPPLAPRSGGASEAHPAAAAAPDWEPAPEPQPEGLHLATGGAHAPAWDEAEETPAVAQEYSPVMPVEADRAMRKGPGFLAAEAAALGICALLTALWVVCAARTGMVLPELAVLVGCAAGLTFRRLGISGQRRAAVAAGLISLVAAAAGLVLAAVAVIAHTGNATFLTTLSGLNRSSLPGIWAQIGAAGAALGAAGVIVAGTVAAMLPRRRPPSD